MERRRLRAVGEQGAHVAPARLGDDLQRAFLIALKRPVGGFEDHFHDIERVDVEVRSVFEFKAHSGASASVSWIGAGFV